MRRLFTSESVTEGHPDKLCDYISDSVLDSFLEKDKNARVACETVAGKGEIFITGEINDDNANIIISELLYLDSLNHEDINIYINSPGGSITAGMAIYDTINFIKSDVSTTVVGLAASMASFILSSGKKGKRYALTNSEVMIHQPLGGIKGQATEIKIAADRIIKLKQKLNKLLASNTKQNLNKINKDTERDFFMDANEALNYGIIDKIL